ncbi:hypothetical protein NHX12_007762 [Muraenolepis orangiensis]|uniref:small monomeric GTPase n=1 Tax=Muraenolepis orangiensis TaxID=630683 RepID=A0A9Q0DPS1_9TELE|nr:hypothetical protein NHX12_007762 [Muraenolepis orangiensis]
MALNMSSIRDTKWLTLEVCRQFQRGTCSRSDEECKFAHPSKSCQVENGRVIACFDSLKGRCLRENCKYLHPPGHLKTQLEINGRNNLIQQKTAAAMLAQQMHFLIPGTSMQPMPTFSMAQGLGASPGLSYSPYLAPMSHGMGLVSTEMLPSSQLMVPGSPGAMGPNANALSSSPSQKQQRSDKLEVCREFQRGNCARGETDCRFAHPGDGPVVDSADNTVTVCMDYIKSRCSRENCKYFHPPAHLQAKIKSGQQQVNQAVVQAAVAAAVSFPHSMLHTLPKRQALEKSAGANPLLNPSFLHYQQALANAHLQQPTYFPSGSVLCMGPGAAKQSRVRVPGEGMLPLGHMSILLGREDPEELTTVVVLGSGGVGKSALTVQFVTGTFIEKYDPTIEDFYRKEIEVDSSPSVLEILDTAGTEQFASMRDLYIKNGQGFILVYSLVNQQSFQDIKPMRDQIIRVKRVSESQMAVSSKHRGYEGLATGAPALRRPCRRSYTRVMCFDGYEKVPVILVGNKVDLESEREVSAGEGQALAEEWGCPFMETSAKSKTMVDELFAEIVRQMDYAAQPDKDDPCCSSCNIQ